MYKRTQHKKPRKVKREQCKKSKPKRASKERGIKLGDQFIKYPGNPTFFTPVFKSYQDIRDIPPTISLQNIHTLLDHYAQASGVSKQIHARLSSLDRFWSQLYEKQAHRCPITGLILCGGPGLLGLGMGFDIINWSQPPSKKNVRLVSCLLAHTRAKHAHYREPQYFLPMPDDFPDRPVDYVLAKHLQERLVADNPLKHLPVRVRFGTQANSERRGTRHTQSLFGTTSWRSGVAYARSSQGFDENHPIIAEFATCCTHPDIVKSKIALNSYQNSSIMEYGYGLVRISDGDIVARFTGHRQPKSYRWPLSDPNIDIIQNIVQAAQRHFYHSISRQIRHITTTYYTELELIQR